MNALATVTPLDQSDLVATIERARALLDDGDVMQARLLSASAYEQAKAATSLATRMKASQQLIDKARRLQADALLIESRAGMRLADEYDRAQEEGTVAKRGMRANILPENVSTLTDIGLSAKEIHHARQLRDAERTEPGIVERAIHARVEAGLSATRKSLSHAIGTRSRSEKERGNNAYFTPPEAMRTLLALESFGALVKDPSCGRGGTSKPLEAAGYEVMISDLVDYETTTRDGECQKVGDFLLSRAGESKGISIVTNPPYGKNVLNKFVAHALREHRPRKMALLLNLNFMCGCEDPDRLFAMDENPPARIYVFSRRLPMMHQDGWEGNEASSQMNTAWFVWELDEATDSYGPQYPQLIRVDYKEFSQAAPLAAGGHGTVVSPAAMAFREPDEDDALRTTPRKSVEQRVEEEFERAMRWIAHMEPFGLSRFRSNVGVRTAVGEALIDALAFNGLIEPAGEGEWVISPKWISTAIDVSAVAMTREWRAAREAKRAEGGGA